ncbi:hypothetical protein ABGB17_29895 [Sphaerisporangium sp. B11E5]|uniref:hypothetical protein n=1 Tax=Sphaerisporangium sp. B11E5 TaxID=3153563 RepID=UPI00325F6111
MPWLDTARRDVTRLVCVYNLADPLTAAPDAVRPLNHALDLGRFDGHVAAAGRLLPCLIGDTYIDHPDTLTVDGTTVPATSGRVLLLTTKRDDALLILDLHLPGEPDAATIADWTYLLWRSRSTIRIGETPLLDWLKERVGRPRVTSPAFGRNVHQCVFAGGHLAAKLLDESHDPTHISAEVLSMVFRGTMDGHQGTPLGVLRPPELNNGRQTMLAHGRGVTVAAGWSAPVENALIIAATGLVNAAGVLHRARRLALHTLERNETADITSISSYRRLIADLSDQLAGLQLDLSFGIEIYADTILIPELLIESYHASMRDTAGMTTSLTNTSQIIARVSSVIESRRAALEAATTEYMVRRERIVSTAVALGSILALPPALLFGYFGVNGTDVDANRSIFDLARYWPAYCAAWAPFIIVLIVTMLLRRRIRLKLDP